MSTLSVICIPVAVVLAVISVFYHKRKAADLLMVLAWICCFFSLFGSIFDILQRIDGNDIPGILDIYPTMLKFFAAELIAVAACSLVKIFIKYE